MQGVVWRPINPDAFSLAVSYGTLLTKAILEFYKLLSKWNIYVFSRP